MKNFLKVFGSVAVLLFVVIFIASCVSNEKEDLETKNESLESLSAIESESDSKSESNSESESDSETDSKGNVNLEEKNTDTSFGQIIRPGMSIR